jgi:hypothetical protein
MNKPDERKRGVPGRGQRRKRQRKRQDDTRKQDHQQQQHQQHQLKPTATVSNVNVANDIEEQLSRQRKKKQSENTNATAANDSIEKKEPPPPRKRMGRFQYDQERGAYFPADQNHNQNDDVEKNKKKKQQEELIASNEFAASRATGRTPPASFVYPASLCFSPEKRSRLVAQWGGKSLMESATFTPSAMRTRADQPWCCLFSTSLSRSGRAVSDISCKSELPPWTRTFDISRSATASDHPEALPLLVATLTDEGAMTRTTAKNNNSWTTTRIREPCVTTRFLQGNQGGIDAGFVLQKQDYTGGSDFVRKQVDGGVGVSGRGRANNRYNDAEYLTHIPAKVNDFVGTDDDGAVLFAAMMDGADRRVTPWSIDYRSSTVARAIPVVNFPQSEAVCVATAKGDNGSSPLAYFGHRTGEVTLFDCRSATCQSSLPRKIGGTRQRNEEIRTIVNIFPLAETPHYVLTRGLFDTCRLYDMRKLTSSTSSSCRSNQKEKDPSIVHNLTVPPYVSCRAEKKPSLCSGVATNPSQTFVIAPFTRANTHRSATESCLGIWSRCIQGNSLGPKIYLRHHQLHLSQTIATGGMIAGGSRRSGGRLSWNCARQSRPLGLGKSQHRTLQE